MPGLCLRRLLLPLLLLFGLSACATASSTCGLVKVAEIPITLDRGRPVATVDIDGHPARLLLDTGSAGMALTQAAITRLNLPLDDRMRIEVRGVGGSSSNFAIRVTNLHLGGQSLPEQRAAVLPVAAAAGLLGRSDGLLGLPMLQRFDIDLDMPAHRLGLYRGLYCAGAPLPFAGPAAQVHAYVTHAQPHLMLPVSLDGKKLDAMLDTGSQFTIVLTDAAVSQQRLSHDRIVGIAGAGPSGSSARLHRFDRLAIGADSFARPLLIVAQVSGMDADLVLGMDYLAYRRVFLSFSSGTVFIQPH